MNCFSNYDTLTAGVGRMAAPGLTRTGNMEMEELGPLMGVASLNPGELCPSYLVQSGFP